MRRAGRLVIVRLLPQLRVEASLSETLNPSDEQLAPRVAASAISV